MSDTQVHDLKHRINKKLRLARGCLRKTVAHRALYVRLQQSAADVGGNLSRGAEAVGQVAEEGLKAGRHEGGASENMDTTREVTEELASLTLVDNTELGHSVK
jgi:hypothetical protein